MGFFLSNLEPLLAGLALLFLRHSQGGILDHALPIGGELGQGGQLGGGGCVAQFAAFERPGASRSGLFPVILIRHRAMC
jgi:hypothetical protein